MKGSAGGCSRRTFIGNGIQKGEGVKPRREGERNGLKKKKTQQVSRQESVEPQVSGYCGGKGGGSQKRSWGGPGGDRGVHERHVGGITMSLGSS